MERNAEINAMLAKIEKLRREVKNLPKDCKPISARIEEVKGVDFILIVEDEGTVPPQKRGLGS